VTAVLRGISDYGDGMPALRAKGGDCGGGSEAFVFAPEIARCVATREGNSQDYETTTMVAQCVTGDVTHTLRTEGFDASEDGTGRGNPIVAFNPRATDVPVTGEITGALDASFPGPAICFSAKDYGGDAMTDLAPTLRAGGHSGSHANAGVMPAVAVNIRGRDGGGTAEMGGEVATALRASSGGGDKPHVLTSAVRRLTPRECERLQGFPDNYTLLPGYDADGPRYKALGNSMAVPVMRWIGERIALHMPAANDNAPAKEAA
jgi:DNA (cytosine-5)-methyltransferase 1